MDGPLTDLEATVGPTFFALIAARSRIARGAELLIGGIELLIGGRELLIGGRELLIGRTELLIGVPKTRHLPT